MWLSVHIRLKNRGRDLLQISMLQTLCGLPPCRLHNQVPYIRSRALQYSFQAQIGSIYGGRTEDVSSCRYQCCKHCVDCRHAACTTKSLISALELCNTVFKRFHSWVCHSRIDVSPFFTCKELCPLLYGIKFKC